MVIEIKEIYKCEWCRKLYQIKRFAKTHEQMCIKNSENKRACFGCKFLDKKEVVIYEYGPWGETSRNVNLFHCSKKEFFLYPPKVQIKGNMIQLGDDTNEAMPKECTLYAEQDFA